MSGESKGPGVGVGESMERNRDTYKCKDPCYLITGRLLLEGFRASAVHNNGFSLSHPTNSSQFVFFSIVINRDGLSNTGTRLDYQIRRNLDMQ